jgi:hypothetical protein
VSVGTVVLNYGATNVAPSQEHETLPALEEAVPTSKCVNGLGTNRNLGSQSQE